MSWIVAQLYSDVALRPTRGRRAARLCVARLQSVGPGSGLGAKRSALGANLSVDTYSHDYSSSNSSPAVVAAAATAGAAAAAAEVGHIVKYMVQNTTTG